MQSVRLVLVLTLALSVAGGLGDARGVRVSGAAETADEAAAAAFAAALLIFDGIPEEECRAGNNPELKTCIRAVSSPAEVERGIAQFSLGAADGIGGAQGVLGRTSDGGWGYWFAGQNLRYELLTLPGPMVVCAEGEGLNVRAAPSLDAEVVDALPDLAHVWAEEFLLTEPGGLRSGRGAGWYRLSAPVEGWAAARFLSNTEVDERLRQPACWWRNMIEAPR